MDLQTQARFTSGTNQAELTGANACWQTPPDIFQALCDEFVFDVDLFADVERALVQPWFGPGSPWAEDALTTQWRHWGEVGFANPPYGRFLRAALGRAMYEAKHFRSVFLIPLRLTVPVRSAVFRSRTVEQWLFPDKRITFYENGAPRCDSKGRPMPALFDSTLLVFGPDAKSQPTIREWKVPKHT